MTKRLLACSICMMLIGCEPFGPPMTNEEIVAAAKYCHENNMNAEQVRNSLLAGQTYRVHCVVRAAIKEGK